MQKMIIGYENEGVEAEVFMSFISLLRVTMTAIWRERVTIT